MRAFISYSHADRELMERFRAHLTPLERKFHLAIFSDEEILPGAEWERRVWKEFERSEIIFVIVSVAYKLLTAKSSRTSKKADRYDDSGALESIQTTPYDFEGKYDAIVHICKRYGIQKSECVFVGEGRNDLHAVRELSRAGGLTIGYPPELLVDYADHSLWRNQLDAILDVMFDDARMTPKLPSS